MIEVIGLVSFLVAVFGLIVVLSKQKPAAATEKAGFHGIPEGDYDIIRVAQNGDDLDRYYVESVTDLKLLMRKFAKDLGSEFSFRETTHCYIFDRIDDMRGSFRVARIQVFKN